MVYLSINTEHSYVIKYFFKPEAEFCVLHCSIWYLNNLKAGQKSEASIWIAITFASTAS